ncbi:MAG: D-glycero-beta-D-manno-heptose 1,7-bisphosphate 7-phosphatase [Thermodesulfobacteriota bacterium]
MDTDTAAPSTMEKTRRAVFLDRDGVLNEDRNYLWKPEDFVLLPGAVEALSRLQAAGFLLVVVTNQSGIARGFYTEQDYQNLTAYMRGLLEGYGIRLAGVYHCPHHPMHGKGPYRVSCGCRKPQPGLILRAGEELGIDVRRSFLVGDKQSDMEAGRTAGVGRCILVKTGHVLGKKDIAAADICLNDLREASDWIISHSNAQQTG